MKPPPLPNFSLTILYRRTEFAIFTKPMEELCYLKLNNSNTDAMTPQKQRLWYGATVPLMKYDSGGEINVQTYRLQEMRFYKVMVDCYCGGSGGGGGGGGGLEGEGKIQSGAREQSSKASRPVPQR